MDTQVDLFAEHPDAEHPIRWQPADGDVPRYIPVFEAVRRLSGYYVDTDESGSGWIERTLRSGVPLRTPAAFYQLHEAPRGAREARREAATVHVSDCLDGREGCRWCRALIGNYHELECRSQGGTL